MLYFIGRRLGGMQENLPFKFKMRNVAGGTSESVASAIQMTPCKTQAAVSTQHE